MSLYFIKINWFAIIKEYFGDDVTQDTEVCVRRKGFFDLVDRILRNETDNKNRLEIFYPNYEFCFIGVLCGMELFQNNSKPMENGSLLEEKTPRKW